MTRDDLLRADRRALRDALARGHHVTPEAIAGWRYRGVSLGLPGWVDRLAWKTFAKVFYRDPGTDRVRGWNVRLRQTGLDGPLEPLERRGRPITFGHFHVVDPEGYGVPRGADRGLLLDYALGGNSPLDPTNAIRDPIVALEPGDARLLLGWTYLEIGRMRIPTPSFFSLERTDAVHAGVAPPRSARAAVEL